MELGITLGAEVGARRVPNNVFLVRNGDGKPEESCLEDIMGLGYSDVE